MNLYVTPGKQAHTRTHAHKQHVKPISHVDPVGVATLYPACGLCDMMYLYNGGSLFGCWFVCFLCI